MDIEWAKDGIDGKLYIVQARPETVCSQSDQNVIERYELNNKADVLVEGRAIGQRIGSGPVRLVDSLDQMSLVQEGDVLVTDMTDPDWGTCDEESVCDCDKPWWPYLSRGNHCS